MPIHRLKKEHRNRWTTISNFTIEGIRNSDALAVWVFLMSKPDDWIIIKSYIQKELGIGRDRLKKAVSRLRELGLWRSEFVRNSDGLMQGSVIILYEEIDASLSRGGGNPSLRGSNSSDIKPLYNTNLNLEPNIIMENNNNPALPATPAGQRVDFISLFGLEWNDAYSKHLCEQRACTILRKYGVVEPAHVRRLIAEWSAIVLRGLTNTDAAASLVWLCHQKELLASKEGDELLLSFS